MWNLTVWRAERVLKAERRGRRALWHEGPQYLFSLISLSSSSFTGVHHWELFTTPSPSNVKIKWFHRKNHLRNKVLLWLHHSLHLFINKCFDWDALEDRSAWKILSGFPGLFRISLFSANFFWSLTASLISLIILPYIGCLKWEAFI